MSLCHATKVVRVDFSAIECSYPDQLIAEEPNKPVVAESPADYVFKLGDCELKTLRGLQQLITRFTALIDVKVLDLRCNRLTEIAGVQDLPNLKVLYAHGNELQQLTDLNCILNLGLEILTVHGNPLSLIIDYRIFIIHKIPALKQLDFCAITRNEREWTADVKPNLTKRRENVVLQKLRTKGQVDEYVASVRAEQQRQKEDYERKRMEEIK